MIPLTFPSNLLRIAVLSLHLTVQKLIQKSKNVEQYERRMDVDALVERAVAGIMVTEITPIEEAQDEVDTLIEDLL